MAYAKNADENESLLQDVKNEGSLRLALSQTKVVNDFLKYIAHNRCKASPPKMGSALMFDHKTLSGELGLPKMGRRCWGDQEAEMVVVIIREQERLSRPSRFHARNDGVGLVWALEKRVFRSYYWVPEGVKSPKKKSKRERKGEFLELRLVTAQAVQRMGLAIQRASVHRKPDPKMRQKMRRGQ
ncbi:hypothetical protein R3P38DRAFT_2815856 [Favolaschia claudopus]|uniref:Uncharacterized protein n=1 Tax=Favolaschia claudopus TaxID=2862362 RepID=A0AAV9Z0L2_9AGAR